ncbi:MAG: hypothetical protein ACO3I4_02875 [Candidatus Kapaibacteriota bacterium]
MKAVLSVVALVATSLLAVTPAMAQESLSPAPTKTVVLEPKMKLVDVKNVAAFIQGVDLRGTEVDAYLDTRKVLTEAAAAAEKGGKKDEDLVSVSMRLDQAQNLFTLMQRGSLKGAEAEKYKEIIDALKVSVEEAQKKQK